MSAAGGPPVRRNEIIGVLSLAVDFAIGQSVGYGLRTAVGSMALARDMGGDEAFAAESYYQGLLQASGCNAETDVLNALFGDEIRARQDLVRIERADPAEFLAWMLNHTGAGRATPGASGDEIFRAIMGAANKVFNSHCEVASKLAQRLGLSDAVQRNLGQTHERWDGAGTPDGLAGEAIALPVRIATVVHHCIRLSGFLPVEDVAQRMRDRSAAAYDPAVVDAVLPRLAMLIVETDDTAAWELAICDHPPDDITLEDAELDIACEVLADFIDLKSPAIAGHSRAVASLADAAAKIAGLSPDDRALVRRGGLLHDLGYTAIPGTQRLSQAGSEQARLHPYFAERLLHRAPGLAPIGAVIAQHHERLDGSGFHRACRGPDISAASRLLAAADTYQTLTEARSGRAALSQKQAAQSLRDEAHRGCLDGEAVAAVLEAAGQGGRAKKVTYAAGLTAREIEVLQALARGGTNKEIGSELGLSPKTVDNHMQSIYSKLGVKTRGGATLFALEHGLLQPGKAQDDKT
jgi:HD-GYP domain-containing protein (c-di-GMP phosphodiesterase class II)